MSKSYPDRVELYRVPNFEVVAPEERVALVADIGGSLPLAESGTVLTTAVTAHDLTIDQWIHTMKNNKAVGRVPLLFFRTPRDLYRTEHTLPILKWERQRASMRHSRLVFWVVDNE